MLKFIKKYHNVDNGLLLLRIGLALVFMWHGWGKIQNMEATAGFFSSLGLNMFWVWVVAWVEFLGGIALLVGLLSRLAALALAVNMFFAIYLVQWSRGWAGYEFELMLLLALLAVHLAGPGRYAITKRI